MRSILVNPSLWPQGMYAAYAERREKITDMKGTAGAAVLEASKYCKADRTIKEIAKSMGGANAKKSVMRASRDLVKILNQRQQEEAKRQGIDVNDLAAFAKVRVSLFEEGEGGGAAQNHAAAMVPRFGSDLGFTRKGIMARARLAHAHGNCCMHAPYCGHALCAVRRNDFGCALSGAVALRVEAVLLHAATALKSSNVAAGGQEDRAGDLF